MKRTRVALIFFAVLLVSVQSGMLVDAFKEQMVAETVSHLAKAKEKELTIIWGGGNKPVPDDKEKERKKKEEEDRKKKEEEDRKKREEEDRRRREEEDRRRREEEDRRRREEEDRRRREEEDRRRREEEDRRRREEEDRRRREEEDRKRREEEDRRKREEEEKNKQTWTPCSSSVDCIGNKYGNRCCNYAVGTTGTFRYQCGVVSSGYWCP